LNTLDDNGLQIIVTNIKEYFGLLNLIERIVPKILDYDGYYIDCRDSKKKSE
jgi:hypothetical protein